MSSENLVSLSEINAAAARIAGAARRTRAQPTELGSQSRPLWLKPESLQVGGSFKFRGATNAIAQLDPESRRRGVVTHSSGNHAQAVARAGKAAGVEVTVVMPRGTARVKREATEAQGANVVLVDAAERASTVDRLRSETGAVFIPPFDHPQVIAGQGTIGLEIAEDLPDVSTVWVPVSGGGLISGVATAIKALRPEVQVMGVEPDLAGDLAEGFAKGERTAWPVEKTSRTMADGLRVAEVGALNWAHISAYVDGVVTVTEQEIAAAMRTVLLEAKLLAEPSGATAVAGFLRHGSAYANGPAVAVISGGNVDADRLVEVLGS